MTESAEHIDDAWRRIEEWYRANAPAEKRNWAAPASGTLIRILESSVKTPLPAGFVRSYLLHDGDNWSGIFEEGELMAIGRILEALEIKKGVLRGLREEGIPIHSMVECDPAIQRRVWDTKWLPFTDSGAGDHLCIDFHPAKQGTHGQIIWVSHETGPKNVVAPSFDEFLVGFANDLERGRYRYSPENMQIVSEGRP